MWYYENQVLRSRLGKHGHDGQDLAGEARPDHGTARERDHGAHDSSGHEKWGS